MAIASPAQTLTPLYSFCSLQNCADGGNPAAGLEQAADGNFYGTTLGGGLHSLGTVFKITPSGTLTTLHSFDGTGGSQPKAALVQATDGMFYGTTYKGGTNSDGTVFQVAADGTLTTLHSFCSLSNCVDGGSPLAELIQASDGNFYGTTSSFGAHASGTIYKITSGGTLTTLYNFCPLGGACADGRSPAAGLVQASDGNFYGTTQQGGDPFQRCAAGCGTIFKITPSGMLTNLYAFCAQPGCPDGSLPLSSLVQASDGNFYGTTYGGGANGTGGTVFKITPSGTLTTLYSFCSRMSCADGSGPSAGLVQASDGNFYGTTVDGGAYNLGTVFQITPAGTLTTLHSFCAGYPCDDGSLPYSTLVQATDGRFYGTAYGDGANKGGGTVFRLDAGISVFLLSVNKDGNGTVTSADGHINCGSTCSYAYKPGSVVTLTATPDQGWAFAGWTGCDNSQANVCTLTMNKLRTVTAIFKPLYALSVNKTGNGTISSTDGHIYCGSVCSYSYLDGTLVTLSALPSSGYTFTGWTGCDNMNGSYCSVTMTSAKNVTATFATANITLTSLTFKPSYVKGGQLSAGTLTLSGPAPPGGVTVALSSDHPGVAHPPSFVFVPGGKSSAGFAVQTFPVKSNTTVMITATAGSSQVSGTLTVGTASLPPSIR